MKSGWFSVSLEQVRVKTYWGKKGKGKTLLLDRLADADAEQKIQLGAHCYMAKLSPVAVKACWYFIPPRQKASRIRHGNIQNPRSLGLCSPEPFTWHAVVARNCLSSPGASQDQDTSLTEAEQCPEQGCPDKEHVGHPEPAGQRDEQGEQGLSAGDAQSAQVEQGLSTRDAHRAQGEWGLSTGDAHRAQLSRVNERDSAKRQHIL